MEAPDPPDWLRITCQGMPLQVEGVSPTGDRVYFRFRRGFALLELNDVVVWTERYGDSMSDHMDTSLAMALITAQLAAHTAHTAARAALPLGPVPPLEPEAEALMDQWIVTVPPAQD